MGTSHNTARVKRRSKQAPRRSFKSPLDRAAGWELNWPQVTPLFDAARVIVNPCFVYFIGEENGGPIKIGSAKDPILRLRSLQTGNPRRLQVEHVLVGDASLEFLLHECWEPFAVRSQRGQKVDALPGTEWFKEDVRADLEPILQTAAERQIAWLRDTEGDVLTGELDLVIREAHTEHGYIFKPRNEVRLLGAGGGYVIKRRTRI